MMIKNIYLIMAIRITTLNQANQNRMTSGEKKVTRCLESIPEQNCMFWYDIPIGKTRRYPDFIILHPRRGLLFLEIKDWKLETLNKIDKQEVELLTNTGRKLALHPLAQARQYTFAVINQLQTDLALQQQDGQYQGNLIMPYDFGVVFTNITRTQIEQKIPNTTEREAVLPAQSILYKEDLSDIKIFQQRLWEIFQHQFSHTLNQSQIDRVRWHLFPEIRIGKQLGLITEDSPEQSSLPDKIKVMDLQQEKLAHSLGTGHRVIHGVAGSGKTIILLYRCRYLARLHANNEKPILVLCFNTTLATKLRTFIASDKISNVEVDHFHDWCAKQLKKHHISLIESKSKLYDRQVESVITAFNNGDIPREQYSTLLIDEAQDFEPAWLKLVVQMIAPTSDLLVLYDSAQDIYKRATLDFSLASVGIKARGRTRKLKKNYRNTQEILYFAYQFAYPLIKQQDNIDEDRIPLIEPTAAGTTGDLPTVHQFADFELEVVCIRQQLQKWHRQGVAWGEMAILCLTKDRVKQINENLTKADIPHLGITEKKHKQAYDPTINKITVMTIHNSKGLEFPYVAIIGVGYGQYGDITEQVRLLYVGMTRAQQQLLLTISKETEISRQLLKAAESLKQ